MFKESAEIKSNKEKDNSLKSANVDSKFGILLMGVDNDAEREKKRASGYDSSRQFDLYGL